MNPATEKPVWMSKRLIAAVASVLVILFKDTVGITLDPVEVQGIVVIIVGLIVGDSCRGVGVKATAPPDGRQLQS